MRVLKENSTKSKHQIRGVEDSTLKNDSKASNKTSLPKKIARKTKSVSINGSKKSLCYNKNRHQKSS